MKTLLLLRHAKSSWSDPSLDDFDRPLNERGRRAGLTMGKFLKDKGPLPGLIICSSAKRARQTLKRLQKAIGEKIPVRFEDGLYMASPKKMLNILKQADDAQASVMLIGHNPGMHMLALDLADTGEDGAMERMRDKYPTAALAALTCGCERWRDFGACRLDSFIRPKDVEMGDLEERG